MSKNNSSNNHPVIELTEQHAPVASKPMFGRPAQAKTSAQPRSAEIEPTEVDVPEVPMTAEEANAPVTIRPFITIPKTRIGLKWYSFQAGQLYSVPGTVARLLQEKGVA